MFFVAVVLLGLIAWQRIPVELFPPVSGEQLYVSFSRAGSEPEVVEREILLPLQARVKELTGVDETWGEIRGSSGTFSVRFKPGTDLRVRELDLRRLAADLSRVQPQGSFIQVSSDDLSVVSRFAMFVQVTGMDDRNALLDLVQERIEPRLAAVPGVARVMSGGGAPVELTVKIDPDRCAALGVTPNQVTAALARSVRRLEFLGGVEDEAGRTAVVLDGRPRGVVSLAELRIVPQRPVLLRHVADVQFGTGREEMIFRVDGKPTVALVLFQNEGANLVRLGDALRERLDELQAEFAPFGIGFVINFDASKLVSDQLDRLKRLAFQGFLIALAVLFLFLREWRAVAVVAVAVPTSLLAALALLFLAGQSINLITLFGLAVGIGMLVDNSIVVYEAVQRQLERGVEPDAAAEGGVRRTVRAIVAASTTNAIVFLPILFVDIQGTMVRSLLIVLALAILLPMVGALLVAIGLVPLLARHLAAPAAIARLAILRRRREEMGGLTPPDRGRALFSGLLTAALRRPAGWLTAVIAAVLFTVVVALPWVAVGTVSQESPEADSIRLSIEIDGGASMESATGSFDRLERAVGKLPGIDRVESVVREDGGALTVHLVEKEERPAGLNANRVRRVVREAADELKGVTVTSNDSGGGPAAGGGGLEALLGDAPAETVLSGPDSRQLELLAKEIQAQLEAIPEIGPEMAHVNARGGLDEIRVLPDRRRLQAYGLTADQVLPVLAVIRREGVQMRTGFTLMNGREIPLTVRREEDKHQRAGEELRELRVDTPAGVLPLGAVATVRRMPPPPAIQHHNGRREISVTYQLGSQAPATGPARLELERQIQGAIQQVHRPSGYTVETPSEEEGFSWFKTVLVPVVLLLFAVLAFTFESLTLPLLVLVALPLTVLGAIWALLINGQPADTMALVGALALIGLTVNPAILLVDRMQQRARKGGLSAGAAALAAVRERARPVLMTVTTTVAGLWPLSLVTGQQNEIWPPFATIVMGGLVTSTVLTLLVIPVGFVFLNRLDRLFGRLGPWFVLGWLGATAAIMTPLIRTGLIDSMTWRILTTVVVATLSLAAIVLFIRKPERPEPEAQDGPPVLRVRHLHKIYGRPGPVGRAWRLPHWFAAQVKRRGGVAFSPWMARARIAPLVVVGAGAVYLANSLQTVFWRLLWIFVVANLVAALARQLRRARGKADEMGHVDPGGAENLVAAFAPWAAYVYIVLIFHLLPRLAGEATRIPVWLLAVMGPTIALIQFGRRTAVRLARGQIQPRVDVGRLRHVRTFWRGLSRRLFGLDLPREEVHALAGVTFEARQGMIGILGPNGAGKTTLLRQLAGILDPSIGRITLGNVPLAELRRYLARWVGYLPQDFGLPDDLSAREYLDYYALLYEIGSPEERKERVERLLTEVGLANRADENIGGYSGGMRQRVAVARTLLRLPPVIIVDEPTVGLDPRERIRFRNLLSGLAQGRVVLFSTHVVEDVSVACERVLVLAGGRLVFDSSPALLAERAEGRVWELWLPEGDAEAAMPSGALIVDQVPGAGGEVRSRVLSEDSPHPEARPLPPTAEDGYLWLVGAGAAA